MERLNGIFEREGRKRGDLNEGIVDEVLVELKKEEEILKFEQSWRLDRIYKIDRLIYLPSGDIFAIQVKSSPKGAEKHYQKYGTTLRYKNKDMPCLVLVINTKHLIDRSQLKIDIKNFIQRRFSNVNGGKKE